MSTKLNFCHFFAQIFEPGIEKFEIRVKVQFSKMEKSFRSPTNGFQTEETSFVRSKKYEL